MPASCMAFTLSLHPTRAFGRTTSHCTVGGQVQGVDLTLHCSSNVRPVVMTAGAAIAPNVMWGEEQAVSSGGDPAAVTRKPRRVVYILYSIFCILYSVFYILYSIFCILYSVFCILYSVFYILYSSNYSIIHLFYNKIEKK
jgi:hypothetical protein